MSTNTVSNETLRYIEPHEVPVVRYNNDRRGSLLDAEVENLDKSKYKNNITKRIVPQCGKRITPRNSSENCLDPEIDHEGRRISETNAANQAAFSRLFSQLSKTDDPQSVSVSWFLVGEIEF